MERAPAVRTSAPLRIARKDDVKPQKKLVEPGVTKKLVPHSSPPIALNTTETKPLSPHFARGTRGFDLSPSPFVRDFDGIAISLHARGQWALYGACILADGNSVQCSQQFPLTTERE